MFISLTPETFNITSTFRLSFRFTYGSSRDINLAFDDSVLEEAKDLGRTIPSLFRFGFQDDEEPELKLAKHVPS
jgi:hypothetical protein